MRDDAATSAAKSGLAPAPDFGWGLMGLIGLLFFVVGATDLGLAWMPLQVGNPDWEFGTVSRTYENLPLLTLGLTLLLGAGVARGARWWVIAVSSLVLLLVAALAFAALLYASNVPLALRTVTEPLARSGLKRALVKGAVQGTLYPLVLLVVGVKGLRHATATRR